MTTVTLDQTSREILYATDINAFLPGSLDATDPTALDVFFAFVPAGAKPTDADWHAGAWGSETMAQITVGPDDPAYSPGSAVALSVGAYRVWLRIDGAIERPKEVIGQLQIV